MCRQGEGSWGVGIGKSHPLGCQRIYVRSPGLFIPITAEMISPGRVHRYNKHIPVSLGRRLRIDSIIGQRNRAGDRYKKRDHKQEG